MRQRTSMRLVLAAVLGGLLASHASAASPRLRIILPRGVQRGTEAVLRFQGSRLSDAEEVLFYGPGVEVIKLEPEKDNRLLVHVKVAEDCRLGEHVAQVRTRSGISDYRTFYVGALPAVDEEEPNTSFEEPQRLEPNVTVTGRVTNEDVDYFAVDLKKGQRLSVEIEAMRLGSALFDPYVAILDSDRFALSSADDSTLVHQDAITSIVAPEDGRYTVEVRESAYGGGGNSRYRLHVGTFPRPLAVYPAGGPRGKKVEVRYLADVAGPLTETLTVPDGAESLMGLFARDKGGIAPSANPFRVFDHGNVLEQEPNDTLEEASPAELPLAFNGIISKEGDVDCFRFTAEKGQRFDVGCYARRVRSPLDPVMAVYRAGGKRLEANDDSAGTDSAFRFRAPADGEYVLRVTDHRGRGGPNFVYRVEFSTREPSLRLQIPRVERYSQVRQTIVVPRGNRYATLLNARRRGFRGEVVLDEQDLPEGLTMQADPLPAGMNQMPVLFEAAEDAPVSGRLVDFTGRYVDPDSKREIVGRFWNTADLVRGRPGQSIYWSREVEQLAVAVVEEVPFRLEIVEPKVPLVRNGSMQLKVVAHRKEGFDQAIRVELPFRPPGLGASSRRTIPKGKNEVLYPLNANGKAALGDWKIYALGSANADGTVWVSSQLANLTIAEPYLQLALKRAAVEQGQEAQIFGEVEVNHEFEGKAKVKLLGLPNKVTAPELELTKDQQELVFPVTTEKDTRPGRHKNLFCQVVVTENGEPIVHRLGRTELRIDKPLPKPKDEPEKPKKVAKKEEPEKPKKKPLSRLEQLRLQAKKRAAAAAESGEDDSKPADE